MPQPAPGWGRAGEREPPSLALGRLCPLRALLGPGLVWGLALQPWSSSPRHPVRCSGPWHNWTRKTPALSSGSSGSPCTACTSPSCPTNRRPPGLTMSPWWLSSLWTGESARGQGRGWDGGRFPGGRFQRVEGRALARCLMLEEFQNLQSLAVVRSLGLGNHAGAWNCPSVAVGPRASLSISGLRCSYLLPGKGPPWGVVVKMR